MFWVNRCPGKILLVDDDVNIVDFLSLALGHEGFEVIAADNGVQAMRSAEASTPDLVILDVMLPQLDGLSVCRRLRASNRTSSIPILMLTAKEDVESRVAGLDAGADDYLVKPFAYRELRARIQVLLRRQEGEPERRAFSQCGVILDRDTREASRNGLPLPLTAREFDLMALLLANAGRVLSRDSIMSQVWGSEYAESNVLAVCLHSLRQKLGLPNVIQTIRDAGFVFRC